MNKIIDPVEDLMGMSSDDLDEKLIEPKYNNANLREALRRTLKKTNEYKKAFEYQLKVNDKLEEEIKTSRSEYSSFYE